VAKRYRIVGMIKNKRYRSRKTYSTEPAALKAAYEKVYMKDGNRKRKNQLHDFYVEAV